MKIEVLMHNNELCSPKEAYQNNWLVSVEVFNQKPDKHPYKHAKPTRTFRWCPKCHCAKAYNGVCPMCDER